MIKLLKNKIKSTTFTDFKLTVYIQLLPFQHFKEKLHTLFQINIVSNYVRRIFVYTSNIAPIYKNKQFLENFHPRMFLIFLKMSNLTIGAFKVQKKPRRKLKESLRRVLLFGWPYCQSLHDSSSYHRRAQYQQSLENQSVEWKKRQAFKVFHQ